MARKLWNQAVYWKLSLFKGINGVLIILGTFVATELRNMKWSNMDSDDRILFFIGAGIIAGKAIDMFLDQTIAKVREQPPIREQAPIHDPIPQLEPPPKAP